MLGKNGVYTKVTKVTEMNSDKSKQEAINLCPK